MGLLSCFCPYSSHLHVPGAGRFGTCLVLCDSDTYGIIKKKKSELEIWFKWYSAYLESARPQVQNTHSVKQTNKKSKPAANMAED
jgi:hypothetical protein